MLFRSEPTEDDLRRLKASYEFYKSKFDEKNTFFFKVIMLEQENARLKAQVESLKKLGTEMGKHLPDTDAANRAYIDFEMGGQP